MHKLLLASMAMSAGTPQVVAPTLMAPASLSPMSMTAAQIPSPTMGKFSRPLVSAPALALQPTAVEDMVSPLISAAHGQENGGQMFDASVSREAGALTLAESSPKSSNWKHLSKNSVNVLQALTSGGEMDGYKLMSRTGLDAGQLSRSLQEISSYPLIRLATVAGYTSVADVGDSRVSLLPSAAGTIDLLLNETWSNLSKSSLAVLRALNEDKATDGNTIMSRTGFDQKKLSAALAEISRGRSPLVAVSGTIYGPEVGFSTVAPLPSTARFIEALLAYRK